MVKKLFWICLVLFLLGGSLTFAQQTVKQMTISQPFANVQGTPRVVRSDWKHVWVMVWRQQGTPSRLMIRTILPSGALGGMRVLVPGVGSTPGSFDIAYDSVDWTYLVAFETVRGLQVQFLNANAIKQGPPVLIEGGISGSMPRLVYNHTAQNFTIFWLSTLDGVGGKVLKSQVLDKTGKLTGSSRVLKTAPGATSFVAVSAAENPKSGAMLVMVSQAINADVQTVFGLVVRPDGSLLRPAVLRFQANTAGLKTSGEAAFSTTGVGFGVWSDRTTVKYRKLSPTVSFASPNHVFANAADADSTQASLVFDSRNNQFIAAWTSQAGVQAAAINAVTGAVNKQPFQVAATTAAASQNAAIAFDSSVANVLIVWEDSSVPSPAGAVSFRVRAALFSLSTQNTAHAVSIGDNFFSPASLTILQGSTVVWTNNGSNSHTVTSGSPSDSPGSLFDSGVLGPGHSFQFTFNNAGTFNYYCRIHGAMMSGTITVTGAPAPGPGY